MDYRIEKDSLGEVRVPAEALWGAQTERARLNFVIGTQPMPTEIINSIAVVKKAAACANCDCGVLPEEKRDLIIQCCDEIMEGSLPDEFPLPVWQTGSGTQTNMNVNEVVSNRAEILKHGEIRGLDRFVHPNDDVNRSQSTNDVFPTALRLATVLWAEQGLLPALQQLHDTLAAKSEEFAGIVKIGRTHLMDATPLTLGQEFSGYVSQIQHCMEAIRAACVHVSELPVGGTAVGTGLNTPAGYTEKMIVYLNLFTGLNFTADGVARLPRGDVGGAEAHGGVADEDRQRLPASRLRPALRDRGAVASEQRARVVYHAGQGEPYAVRGLSNGVLSGHRQRCGHHHRRPTGTSGTQRLHAAHRQLLVPVDGAAARCRPLL